MKKKTYGRLSIGTSGIVIPGNKSTFPPEFQQGSRLHYYSSLFNSVEINSSFYKIPRLSTFEHWSEDVPGIFRFTLKLFKEVTHGKELKTGLESIVPFLSAARGIGKRKGCLLVQFPGKITLEYYSQVEKILVALQENEHLQDWQIAVEFRNNSWYVSETDELLKEHQASLVLHDISKGRNMEPMKGTRFIYARFHGPAGDYRGSYSDDFLQEKAREIKGWIDSGKDVYVYFNNTAGNAFENAQALQRFCEK